MRRTLHWLLAVALGQPVLAELSVQDDSGQAVTLAQPARRIVTLSPHATELVYAAGAGDRLVAVAAYSDWPLPARSLPRIGGAGGLDRERLLALQPDLVIAWASGTRPGDLAWLEHLGVAVFRSEPRRLADIAANLRSIGQLAGRATPAAAAAARFEAALRDLCPDPPTTASVLYRLWEQPLLTYGGRHWSNDALRHVGLRNLFAEIDRAVITPSREAVIAARPDYVLSQHPATTAAVPGAHSLTASRSLDRPTPRIIEALHGLCAARAKP